MKFCPASNRYSASSASRVANFEVKFRGPLRRRGLTHGLTALMTVRTGVFQTGHSLLRLCISKLAMQGTYHWDGNVLTAFRSRFELLSFTTNRRKKPGKSLRGRYYQSGVSSSLRRQNKEIRQDDAKR